MTATDKRAQAVIALLSLTDISSAVVKENDVVPTQFIELWKSRGYKITSKKGCLEVKFICMPRVYIYPLHMSKKEAKNGRCA